MDKRRLLVVTSDGVLLGLGILSLARAERVGKQTKRLAKRLGKNVTASIVKLDMTM